MYLVRRRGRETRAPVERCHSMSAGMCSDTVDLYTLTGSTDNCACQSEHTKSMHKRDAHRAHTALGTRTPLSTDRIVTLVHDGCTPADQLRPWELPSGAHIEEPGERGRGASGRRCAE